MNVSWGASRTTLGISLAFDPSKSHHYKVICVRHCDSLRSRYQIELYSSKTCPWRLSSGLFTVPNPIQFNRGVFCNGAIHWISDSESTLCFDVHVEQLREMPVPPLPDVWDERRCRYFGVSRDHLHIVESFGLATRNFDVYEMERNYSGWFVKYRVDLDVVVAAFPEMNFRCSWNINYGDFWILSLVRKERDEESCLVLHLDVLGKAIRYNLKDRSFKQLRDFAHRDTAFDNYESFQYIESLACV